MYLRVVSCSERVQVYLLTGKSKFTPLKNSDKDKTLTVPRLKLCAALLLAQLLHRFRLKLTPTMNISKVHAWTDSSVVLSWLTTDQKSFNIFVTNHGAKIHHLIPNYHASTTENPADLLHGDCYLKPSFPVHLIRLDLRFFILPNINGRNSTFLRTFLMLNWVVPWSTLSRNVRW